MGIPMTHLKDFVGHPICWVSAAAFGTKTNQKEKRKRAAQKKEILTALTQRQQNSSSKPVQTIVPWELIVAIGAELQKQRKWSHSNIQHSSSKHWGVLYPSSQTPTKARRKKRGPPYQWRSIEKPLGSSHLVEVLMEREVSSRGTDPAASSATAQPQQLPVLGIGNRHRMNHPPLVMIPGKRKQERAPLNHQ